MKTKRKLDTWLVYIACCFVTMFDFPLILTFGALYVSLLDKYGESRSSTAVVQSVFMGCSTITSVLSGVLVKQFGAARVSFLGSVLLSSGFVFSYFATSILALDIMIGVVSGIGNCLLFVSSTVVVGSIFEGTAKEIALSIHNTVIGLGSIIYPYIFNSLSTRYGASGTFFILGAMLLNNFVVALLILVHEKRTVNNQNGQCPNGIVNKIDNLSHLKERHDITESQAHVKETGNNVENRQYLMKIDEADNAYRPTRRIDKTETRIYFTKSFDKTDSRPYLKNTNYTRVSRPEKQICTRHLEFGSIHTAGHVPSIPECIDKTDRKKRAPEISSEWEKTDYKQGSQIAAVNKNDNKSNVKDTIMNRENLIDLQEVIDKEMNTEVRSTIVEDKGSFTLPNIRTRFVQLISIRYIFVLMGTACVATTFGSYLVVFEDVFVSKECSSNDIQNQYLAFNTASTISRVFPIIFSKIKSGTDLVVLLTVGSILGLIGQLFIWLFTEVRLLYIGNFLSGFALGSVLSASTVSVANITPKDVFELAFGLLVTVLGILSVVGGPLYGYIRDETSSYASALLLTAAANAIAALLFMTSRLVLYCKTKKKLTVCVSS